MRTLFDFCRTFKDALFSKTLLSGYPFAAHSFEACPVRQTLTESWDKS